MLKRVAISLLAFANLCAPALAQSCDPARLAAAIDTYAAAPFSARTWRVLQGLGDPMIDSSSIGSDAWTQQEGWKTLAAELAPQAEGLQNVSYSCRISYPLSVLERRMGSLGRNHPYVKQWLLAQEKVFQACSNDGADDIALPPPLDIEPVFANIQKADRAYQEASIAFYRNRERALPLFRSIAASSSPHRAAARYNIANLLANAKQPEAARKEAEAIIADPSLGSVHAITRELLGYIANQEDTAEGWTGVIERNVAILETPAGNILASDALKREYASALYDIDFAGVRGKDDDWWLDGKLPEDATISKALVDMSRKHPMVLWMIAGQSANEHYVRAPWSLIGSKWQDRMTAYVAKALAVQPSGAGIKGPALQMLNALAAKPDDATRASVWVEARSAMAAAQTSCGTDAATASAGLLLEQAVRLSAMAGKYEEAYAGLDAVPFKTASSFYNGAVYHLAQYLVGEGNVKEARTLRDRFISPELLAAIPENMRDQDGNAFADLLAFIAENDTAWKQALQRKSDPASHMLFNLMPTKILWAYATDANFTEADRALFARAAWTRDYALDRKLTAEQANLMTALNPQMAAIAAKVDTDYASASPAHRRLLTILRSPRHNILVALPSDWNPQSLKPESYTDIDLYDHNDKNWWCPLETDRQLLAVRERADETFGTSGLTSYGRKTLADVYDEDVAKGISQNRDKLLKQHPVVKAVNWKEVRALSQMPSAPAKLTRAAIAWGKASKGDDGAPEALALAVKATRYGCNWHGSHESYSKAAQNLLQSKFKSTSWAAATPYWFSCMYEEWDKDGNRVPNCKPKRWEKQAPLK